MDNKSFKKFLSEIRAEFDKQMLQHPYQMNLIDEIVGKSSLKEVAHCRILVRILQYRDKKGSYIYLEDLLNKIRKTNKTWGKLDLNSPNFKLEVFCPSNLNNEKDGRIDILIESFPFAIIIENKANDADYQHHQIGRYIRKIIDSGFSKENIFVLCLPGKERTYPKRSEWIYDNINYQQEFKDRLSVLSYKDDILPWLENGITQSCDREGDKMKKSVELYVDYLHSMFESREDFEEEAINEILKEREADENVSFFSSILLLEKNLKANRNGIIANIDSLRNQINAAMRNLYRSFDIANNIPGNRTLHFGYDISIANRKYAVYVGNNTSGMFCSILSRDGNAIAPHIQKPLKELGLNCYNRNNYLYDGYDRDYRILPKLELFLKVMDKCEELKREEQTKKV